MKLKVWELALFMALIITVLWGVLLDQRQQELEGKLIRLHVLAHADSAVEQEIKLYVRERIWAELGLLLGGEEDRPRAQAAITRNLDRITDAAQAAVLSRGAAHPVSAVLTQERYPSRSYESFRLPAGIYSSLRVEIGAAQGQNWWCVVFPPLCIQLAVDDVEAWEAAGLSAAEIGLITGAERGYTVRFRALEIIGGIRAMFRE